MCKKNRAKEYYKNNRVVILNKVCTKMCTKVLKNTY